MKHNKKKRYNFSLNRLTDERLDELVELLDGEFSRSQIVEMAVKRLHKAVIKKQQDN